MGILREMRTSLLRFRKAKHQESQQHAVWDLGAKMTKNIFPSCFVDVEPITGEISSTSARVLFLCRMAAFELY